MAFDTSRNILSLPNVDHFPSGIIEIINPGLIRKMVNCFYGQMRWQILLFIPAFEHSRNMLLIVFSHQYAEKLGCGFGISSGSMSSMNSNANLTTQPT